MFRFVLVEPSRWITSLEAVGSTGTFGTNIYPRVYPRSGREAWRCTRSYTLCAFCMHCLKIMACFMKMVTQRKRHVQPQPHNPAPPAASPPPLAAPAASTLPPRDTHHTPSATTPNHPSDAPPSTPSNTDPGPHHPTPDADGCCWPAGRQQQARYRRTATRSQTRLG